MGLFDKLLKGAVDAIDNAAAKNGNGPTGLKDLFNQAMDKKDEAINGSSSKLLFIIWAVVALLVIALYWVLWIRQYKKGNHFEDIYGTGIPLFIIPAAFVLVTGIFSMNFMLIIFSVLDIVCEYCSAYGVRKRLHPAKTEESSDEAEKKENEDGE